MSNARAHAHACAQTQVEERLSLRVEELEVFKQVPACCAAVQTAPPKRKNARLCWGGKGRGLHVLRQACRSGQVGSAGMGGQVLSGECVRACVRAGGN